MLRAPVVIIHLGRRLLDASSSHPETGRAARYVSLFGLAPDGVYRTAGSPAVVGALLPHHFTFTCDARRLHVKGAPCPSVVSFLWHFP
jgi:hypothetical protein